MTEVVNGWKFLDPTGATEWNGQRYQYALPSPGEKWGAINRPSDCSLEFDDGQPCGSGRLHIMRAFSNPYGGNSSGWWPWYVQATGVVTKGNHEKFGATEIRLRRVEPKVFHKCIRLGMCKNANLIGANLRDANLRSADLRGANLRSANLRSANLVGSDLRDADLENADLRDANLTGANLANADLRNANLRDSDLKSAYLIGAYLIDADLRNANLARADLRGAYLIDADLRDADLRGADLRGADLRGANLENTLIERGER